MITMIRPADRGRERGREGGTISQSLCNAGSAAAAGGLRRSKEQKHTAAKTAAAAVSAVALRGVSSPCSHRHLQLQWFDDPLNEKVSRNHFMTSDRGGLCSLTRDCDCEASLVFLRTKSLAP